VARDNPRSANRASSFSDISAVDELSGDARRPSKHFDAEDGELTAAVTGLSEDIHVLRQAIDDLRDDVMWAVRNALAPSGPPFQLTSMPRDPTARDFGARINGMRPSDLPAETVPEERKGETAPSEPVVTVAEDDPEIEVSDNPPPTLSVRQFNIDPERVPSIPFCCVKPELEWVGEHDDPSIVCAHCCETVAVLHDDSMRGSRDNQSQTPSSTPSLPENQNEETEQLEYCCAEPSLQWHGDPDAPGIACAHCGYLIAEAGQVLIWRDTSEEEADEPEKPQGPQQQTLWSADEA
jgi:DNA-directed RNA polymerase subunit RPC12/RpoP